MEELWANPLARVAVGVVALVILWRLVSRLLRGRPKTSAYHVRVRCPSCGWQGSVGKYNRRCSACNSTQLISLD
jgi:hypothetical protein